MDRQLSPEWLDSLPSDHPDAIASRRDLRLIDFFMGNSRWILRQLSALLRQSQQPLRVVEIGAGDGHLGRCLVKLYGNKVHFSAVDLTPRPIDWPETALWIQANVFSDDWMTLQALSEADVVVASLMLHHFTTDELKCLGSRFLKAQALLFSEPARRRSHLWQGLLLAPVCNRVTRHDLPVSVRAGFLPGELGQHLGLSRSWQVSETMTFFGALRFKAMRHDPQNP